uniref:PhoH-like protein n=1 Tax=viral metagenome TaxID=1070528 RepID=A0A6C0DMD6_9ZZZZ
MNLRYGGRLVCGSFGGFGSGQFRHYSSNGAFGKTLLVMRSKQSISDTFDNIISKKIQGQNIKKIAPVYKPKSPNQELYYKYLNDPDIPIVFGIGPAGCGKTLLACVTAIEELRRGNIQKIVLTRPIVPVEEEELGFLPGNLIHKMDPWTRPIFDIFLEFYQQRDLDSMLQTGVIEISPLAYMRGRTFKRAFIIADEMQNSTPNQMLMLTTRIGDSTKMAITGDLKQSDRCAANGLLDFMNKYKAYRKANDVVDFSKPSHKTHHDYDIVNEKWCGSGIGIEMVEMSQKDIERSPIVAKILDIYKPLRISNTENVSPLSLKTPPAVGVSNEKWCKPPKKTDDVDAGVVIDKIIDVQGNVPSISVRNVSIIEYGNTTDTNTKKTYMNYDNGSNDAALIPISHLSKHLGGL